MTLFEKIKLKLKKKSPTIKKTESSSDDLKELKSIQTTGTKSGAIGAKDFPIPTGICNNPHFEHLSNLLDNNINCVFYNKRTSYCFYAGFCDRKQKIDETLVNQYKEYMKNKMNQSCGE